MAFALDPLTWLPNQELFRARLAQRLAAGEARQVALMHMDLDRFQDVNDLLGYEAGDAVLREAAARIARTLPKETLLGHFGGDDFAAVVQAAEVACAARLARTLLDACRQPFLVDCLSLRVTASVGIALPSGPAPDAAGLIAHAAYALHRAKVAGRDRCFPSRAAQN